MPLRIRPTVSRSPFLRTRLMRELRLPEARVEKTEEERVVVVAVAAVAEAPELRVAKDLLVKMVIADPALSAVSADLALRVETDLLVKAATDPLVRVATDLLVGVATEEEVATEVDTEVPVVVLNSLLTAKAALMSDLPAPKVKPVSSVAAVVVSLVVTEEKVASVEDAEDSVVEIEEMRASEVAAEASEVETLLDLSMDTIPREVATEEEVRALALPEALLLSDSNLCLIRKFEC